MLPCLLSDFQLRLQHGTLPTSLTPTTLPATAFGLSLKSVMDNSPFRSVLETLQEHIRLAPDSFPPVPANQLLFDPRLAFTTLPTPELSSHLSSLGLPAPLYHELNALLSNDLNEDKSFIEQTQERLIHQLSTLSSSANPSAVPALVQAAFRTFHNRSINSRIDALRRQISDFELKGDSGTESEESSGSDQGMLGSQLRVVCLTYSLK